MTYVGHTDEVSTVVWSPDGMRIASVSHDRTVRIWDAFSGSDYLTYIGHADEGTIVAIDWSPDGKYIASGSLYGPIHVWETITGRDIVTYEFDSHGERFVVKWLDNGARVAAEDDQRVHICPRDTQRARSKLAA